MAVQFLTQDWIDALNGALSEHDAFQSAIANTDLGVQFVVSEAPGGDPIDYYLSISGGNATAALGSLEGADVTIKSNYDTAGAVSKGELNTQTAFMTGKIKVEGNLAVLMMNQNIITQWGKASESLEVDY